MGWIDVLKTLGILRAGSTRAVYRNAGERPIEFQEGGVFDAKKNLRRTDGPDEAAKDDVNAKP